MNYKHLRALTRLAAAQGIGIHALLTLIHIHENQQGIRIGIIAEEFGISTAAATGIADTLENRGLAVRTHSKTDRRKITLSITPEGEALLAECATHLPQTPTPTPTTP